MPRTFNDGLAVGAVVAFFALCFATVAFRESNNNALRFRANPVCAAQASYPVAYADPYVVCQGITERGATTLMVVDTRLTPTK